MTETVRLNYVGFTGATWTSDNSDVATVDSEGNVTGTGVGLGVGDGEAFGYGGRAELFAGVDGGAEGVGIGEVSGLLVQGDEFGDRLVFRGGGGCKVDGGFGQQLADLHGVSPSYGDLVLTPSIIYPLGVSGKDKYPWE